MCARKNECEGIGMCQARCSSQLVPHVEKRERKETQEGANRFNQL